MRRLLLSLTLLVLVASFMTVFPVAAQPAEAPVVRAVLFFSPNCGHCHQVINELILPMLEQYGDQLQVAGIDASQEVGAQMYETTLERYQVPPERYGVPALVIQDMVLVGSREIPERFPALVQEGLAAGGVDWPDIPGLEQALAGPPPEPTATPGFPAAAGPVSSPTSLPQETITRAPAALTIGKDEVPREEAPDSPPADPAGFTLASVVLVGMILALAYAGNRAAHRSIGRKVLAQMLSGQAAPGLVSTRVIPCLCLAGLGVASYLAYVEVNQVEAVCGPVGDCNLVQTSDYALLLGVPVAVWGVVNYLAVAGLWLGHTLLPGRAASLSLLGLVGLVLFGTLFSIYLTCLELFAIHAICAWCLSSAVMTTVLMLLVIVPVTETEGRAWHLAASRCPD